MNPVSVDYARIKTLKSDNTWDFFYIEDTETGFYSLITGNYIDAYYAKARGADETDFETNFKSSATSVSSFGEALSKLKERQSLKILDAESLADGVYEDSIIISHVAPHKTYTLKNDTDPSTGVNLKYKIWGSANNNEFEEIKSETLLAKGNKTSIINNDFWKFTKIAAKGDGGISTITAFLQEG